MRRHGLTIATLRTGDAVFGSCCGIPETHPFPESARRFACAGDFEGQAQGALEVDDQAPAGASVERELIRERTRLAVIIGNGD